MSEVGFVTMGKAAGGADVKPIGVGMLGYAFMGKAHSNAYKTLAYMTWPPPLMPQLVAIAGRNEEAVAEAARRYGFAEYKTDWRAVATDPRVELFDNAGPNNLHAEPTIVAAEAGKHVICEKPLGRDAAESYETWQRVQATGVKHMCAFNYRFVPAVRLAREIIESGELGDIQHFRGCLPAGVGHDRGRHLALRQGDRGLGLARRPRRARDRPRALPRRRDRGGRGDDADVHPGPRRRRRGRVGRAVRERRGRHDRGVALLPGPEERVHVGDQRLQGLDRVRPRAPERAPGALQRLQAGRTAQGFRTVLVSEADHPFWEHWWPQGHTIGWEHTFVHELHHLLTAIRDDARRGAARRHARGRLPRRRGLRRDAALGRAGLARDRHLPLTTHGPGAPMTFAVCARGGWA